MAVRIRTVYVGKKNLLLLKIVLTRASGLATRERTLVVAFTGMDTGVPCKMATGSEGTIASWTDVLLFGGRGGGGRLWLSLRRKGRRRLSSIRGQVGLTSKVRVVELSAHFGRFSARHC